MNDKQKKYEKIKVKLVDDPGTGKKIFKRVDSEENIEMVENNNNNNEDTINVEDIELDESILDTPVDELENIDNENTDENEDENGDQLELIEMVQDNRVNSDITSVEVSQEEKLTIMLFKTEYDNLDLKKQLTEKDVMNKKLQIENYILTLKIKYSVPEDWTVNLLAGTFLKPKK